MEHQGTLGRTPQDHRGGVKGEDRESPRGCWEGATLWFDTFDILHWRLWRVLKWFDTVTIVPVSKPRFLDLFLFHGCVAAGAFSAYAWNTTFLSDTPISLHGVWRYSSLPTCLKHAILFYTWPPSMIINDSIHLQREHSRRLSTYG